MVYEIKTTKILNTDNGKTFEVGNDIAFRKNQAKYIGEIKDITENIEYNDKHIYGEQYISLDDIEDNSCNYVDYD